MKKSVLMFAFTAGLAGLPILAHADLISFLQSVNKQAISDVRNFNDKLSKQFGIPTPNVDAIVKAVPNPEDAFMILQLSQMAHVEPEVVMEKYQRSKGQGWGRVAQDIGIKPGSPEFHALKRGDFEFTGERRHDRFDRKHRRDRFEDEDRRSRSEDGEDEDEGDRGRGHGHGRGRDRGRD